MEGDTKKSAVFDKRNIFFIITALITVVFIIMGKGRIMDIVKKCSATAGLAYFAAEDVKKGEINSTALAVYFGIGLLETILYRDFQHFIDCLLSVAVMFILLMTMYFFARGSLGGGDVKLLTATALLLKFAVTVQMIFMGLLLTVIAGIFMVIIRKGTLKMSMPMVPFLLLGYMINMILEVLY